MDFKNREALPWPSGSVGWTAVLHTKKVAGSTPVRAPPGGKHPHMSIKKYIKAKCGGSIII